GNRIDLILSAESLKNNVLQRVRLGFFGRYLLGIDQLLDERLIFRDLVDLFVADEVRAAVADLDYVDSPRRQSETGKRGSHALELGIGASLVVNQVVRINSGVIQFGDQIVV